MTEGFDLSKQRVLVVGMNITGLACARFLQGRCEAVVLADTRPADNLTGQLAQAREVGCEVVPHLTDPAQAGEVSLMVASPGLAYEHPVFEAARARGVEVIAELELAARLIETPLAVVTGTNGKGTTVSLLGHMLEAAGKRALVCGNIGEPLISFVERSGELDCYVVEASSFQLEATTTLRPRVAVLLNVFPDHLERHGTFQRYVAAKARIFANQTAQDDAVLGGDDPAVLGLRPTLAARPHVFATDAPADDAWLADGDIWLKDVGRLMAAGEIPLPGRHNVRNVMAAALAARVFGAPAQAIVEGVCRMRPQEHVLEFVAEIGGVRFVNDTKATNPGAAIAALRSFNGPVHLIAGGSEKNADFAELGRVVADRAKRVYLIGATAARLRRAIEAAGFRELVQCATLEDAVDAAAAASKPGETVLLAPACASFDMFENYAHRGRAFKEAVARLSSKS